MHIRHGSVIVRIPNLLTTQGLVVMLLEYYTVETTVATTTSNVTFGILGRAIVPSVIYDVRAEVVSGLVIVETKF